jgi:LPXTG-motif cell wall-anchored protein
MKDIELIGGLGGALGGPRSKLVHYEGRDFYQVGSGETLWGVAVDLYNDGGMAPVVWAEQDGLYRAIRGNMNNVRAGDVLLLPASKGVGSMYATGAIGRNTAVGSPFAAIGLATQDVINQTAAAMNDALIAHGYRQSDTAVYVAFQTAVGEGPDGYPGPDTMYQLQAVLGGMHVKPANVPIYPWDAKGGYDGVNAPTSAQWYGTGTGPAPPKPKTGMSGWAWAGIAGGTLLAVGGLGYAAHRWM